MFILAKKFFDDVNTYIDWKLVYFVSNIMQLNNYIYNNSSIHWKYFAQGGKGTSPTEHRVNTKLNNILS